MSINKRSITFLKYLKTRKWTNGKFCIRVEKIQHSKMSTGPKQLINLKCNFNENVNGIFINLIKLF